MKATLERYKLESDLRWRDRLKEMPFFPVPEGYQVCVVPPFGGADARFRVRRPNGKEISVYLDLYGNLGCDTDYWEVYPYKDDVGRCEIGDIETLWKMIKGEDV